MIKSNLLELEPEPETTFYAKLSTWKAQARGDKVLQPHPAARQQPRQLHHRAARPAVDAREPDHLGITQKEDEGPDARRTRQIQDTHRGPWTMEK